MLERVLVLAFLLIVFGVPAGITWLKEHRETFIIGIHRSRYGLVDCGLQARSPVIMVGASVLRPNEDAAGAKSVRFGNGRHIVSHLG